MNVFNSRSVAFALKTTAAAIVAMLVALSFNLPNPGWAALTVFLTSQQVGGAAGAVISRSVYRAFGTLLGAVGTLLVIPACSSAPALLIAGIAAWVGLLVYVSLLDRTPRSYVFLLGAYTLPLIGLPVANSPASAFDIALWRAEEIGLGALLSMSVHSVFVPRSIRPLLVVNVRATVDAAKAWMMKGLSLHPVAEVERRSRERLGAAVAEMRNLTVHLRFEPGFTTRDILAIGALEARLLAILPLLAGVEARLAGIGRADARLAARIGAHLETVRLELEQPLMQADGARLGVSGMALLDAEPPGWEPARLLATGAMRRLAELLEAWTECLALLRRLEQGKSDPADDADRLIAGPAGVPLHLDHGMAGFAAFAVALAVVAAGTLCWVLGWDQGGAAIGIAAASSALTASLDDPRPALRVLVAASVLAVPVAALYAFGALSAVDGPVALAAALAPVFFITAVCLATPAWGLPAQGFMLILLPLLSIQSVQNPDFGSFAATAVAAVMGSSVALVVASLVRVVSAETSVRRVLRAAWRDLAAIAEGKRGLSRAAWTGLMLDRIGLLLPRAAVASEVLRAHSARALDDMRMGANILDLRQAGLAAQPEVRAAIETVLVQIGMHLRQRLERPEAIPAPAIGESIDRVIALLAESDPGLSRAQGLAAATGLRLELFPREPGVAEGDAIVRT